MLKLNIGLSELIGAIIGDGNTYDKRPYYVEITGNSISDRQYFEYLVNLINENLDYSPKLFFRAGALRIRINKKEFVEWVKDLGIPAGKYKFRKVLIPQSIKKSKKFLKFCLRGIFDTDGYVALDKRKVYKNVYIRIALRMKNPKILKEISSCLGAFKIKATLSPRREFLYINGYHEVKKYLKTIGFSNSRHINKINSFYPELISYNCQGSITSEIESLGGSIGRVTVS